MIVVFHNNRKVIQIYDVEHRVDLPIVSENIQYNLMNVAQNNTNSIIGWAHIDLKDFLQLEAWKKLMKHPFMMHSYETSKNFFISDDIGYIEDSPFINVNKNVSYPTWQMSSDVGIIYGSTFLKFKSLGSNNLSFSLFLNCIAKIGAQQGLHGYSSPELLKQSVAFPSIKKSSIKQWEFFWFVKNHYKLLWVLFYMMMLAWYKKKFPLFAFVKGLLKPKIQFKIQFDSIKEFPIIEKANFNYDVLIPTLGREKYVEDVLQDLANQTIIPKKVILIEQQPVENAASKLDFLNNSWPFEIEHSLIYQLGACNARNLGITKIKSDWTFFADDDIRISPNFMEKVFNFIETYKGNAVTLSCLQQGEHEKIKQAIQWSSFGSGCSIVKSELTKCTFFNKAYEFGYGEDFDYGMQLRNKGVDILYFPYESLLHLKAPIGGFRKKIKREWEKEVLPLKPSPTVMVSKLQHATIEQLSAYKIVLFLKYFKYQPIKNPSKYIKYMQQAWKRSQFWANELIKMNS